MEVIFSTFSKKLNSTARSSGGASYSCVLKSESGKTNPYIELSGGGGTANPTAYNYAYIPSYGRYYYVSDWIWTDGKWGAQLTVDVLASFKDAIGASSLYILRASADYDRRILDTKYPAIFGGLHARQLLTNEFTTYYPDGSYVVGVISPSSASGAVAYYVLSYTQMAVFRAFMMGSVSGNLPQWSDDWNVAFPQITGEAIRAMINPFQYVASCMWLPFAMTAGGSASMPFGYWDSGLSFPTLGANVWIKRVYVNVPDDYMDTPEEWRRQAPYATYQLTITPFGTFDIDASYCAQETQLICDITVDPITGGGKLFVIGATTDHVFVDVASQIGIPVQLAQMSTDAIGAAGTYVNSVAQIANQAMSGNIIGAVASTINGIGDTAKATLPTVSTAGNNGGVGGISGIWQFNAYFRSIVETSPNLLGRPLCKTKTPASLGGYMVALNGEAISCAGTKEEKEQIKNFVESGFYYE